MGVSILLQWIAMGGRVWFRRSARVLMALSGCLAGFLLSTLMFH